MDRPPAARSEEVADAPPERGVMPVRWRLIAMLLAVFWLGPVGLALGTRVIGIEAFEAEGPSMEPTLLHGDRFLVDKSAFGLFLPLAREASLSWGAPEVGDVVVIHSPMDEIDIVKRVVAVAGQAIEIRDDVVYVDDAPLVDGGPEGCWGAPTCEELRERLGDRTWWTRRDPISAPSSTPPVRVPPGHVYVLGDHRDRSNDSRAIGMIPVSRIKGRATRIYWSSGDAVRWERVGMDLE